VLGLKRPVNTSAPRPRASPCFVQSLQSIVAGSRDRTLADAPDLSYSMAAEILFLIDTLERSK
jgi:hypothetical protein